MEEDEWIQFEGGECPCGENRMGSPAGDKNFMSDNDGIKGITQEELQQMMEQLPPELLAPDLPMLLASMAATLEEQAWRHLGLVANPITRQVEKDLQKAKISIDVMAFIVSQVSPLVSDAQRGDLQAKVSTLQMNFVQQNNQSGQ